MAAKARFIEPMLLLRTEKLPERSDWAYELKLDGYRAIAYKSGKKLFLRSRNDKDFALRYTSITNALQDLPDGTVIDGEIVALDEAGRPAFNVLQNYGSAKAPLFYYVFDLMMLEGKDVTDEPLSERRNLLQRRVLSHLSEPIRLSPQLDASLDELIASVKAQALEGLVAKRLDRRYESGQRSGAWLKMRVNSGQEFVIGGYTASPKDFDALIIGYYQGGKLIYTARTRNGFTPALRAEIFKRFRDLDTD
jgi:ATP-dependent DNA ligase